MKTIFTWHLIFLKPFAPLQFQRHLAELWLRPNPLHHATTTFCWPQPSPTSNNTNSSNNRPTSQRGNPPLLAAGRHVSADRVAIAEKLRGIGDSGQ
jgi:hypothetical protein